PERLRLQQRPPATYRLLETELREDATRVGRPGSRPRAPELAQRRTQLLVPVGRVEDPPNDELRGDGSVPAVLLESACDVEAADRPEAVELRSLSERNRAASVTPVLADPEAHVLAVTHERRLHRFAGGNEQSD